MSRTIAIKRVDLKQKTHDGILCHIASKLPPHASIEGYMEIAILGTQGEPGYATSTRYHATVYSGGRVVYDNAYTADVLGDRLAERLAELAVH